MTTLFGIKNCDTVKKARQWLDEHQVAYRFHDIREDGLTAEQVQDWVQQLGWETLVNKRSTSWKHLDKHQRVQLNKDNIVDVILASPTLIKRPLLDTETRNKQRHCGVGFKAEDYRTLLIE